GRIAGPLHDEPAVAIEDYRSRGCGQNIRTGFYSLELEGRACGRTRLRSVNVRRPNIQGDTGLDTRRPDELTPDFSNGHGRNREVDSVHGGAAGDVDGCSVTRFCRARIICWHP